ncbi:MAG: ATP phosphoribosyltransferase [Bacteroidia bacterium]|nr:ATP phosphoribosyltransferase [Bacteroidia bacterium]
MDQRIKLAIQKSGRLHDDSIKLLKDCGLKFNAGAKGILLTKASNFPVDVYFLRNSDIPKYVENGTADLGIIGENVLIEYKSEVDVFKKLGFSKCRVSLAIPRGQNYEGPAYFNGKKIATSYPNTLRAYFEREGIKSSIHNISGSVEIAPGIGLAEGVFDIVSTGSTLLSNGLREVQTVLKSEAILVGNRDLNQDKRGIIDKLLFRIEAVLKAKSRSYILLNAPNDNIDEIIAILPGMKSPTVLPLADEGWSSIHSVINDDEYWEVIEQLQSKGAQGILVVPIDKMIL